MKEEIMKFETGDTIETYVNPSALGGVFTIPVSGVYMMSSKTVEFVPTGSFEIVPNDEKKWWQFWKKDYVLKEICVPKEFPDGSNIEFRVKGEQVRVEDTKFITKIK